MRGDRRPVAKRVVRSLVLYSIRYFSITICASFSKWESLRSGISQLAIGAFAVAVPPRTSWLDVLHCSRFFLPCPFAGRLRSSSATRSRNQTKFDGFLKNALQTAQLPPFFRSNPIHEAAPDCPRTGKA
jgi:hypothetical protein